MIDFTETLMLLRAYVQYSLGDACGGLLSIKDEIPSYNVYALKAIPICSACYKEKRLGKFCIDFYKNIEEGKGTVLCPFGIVLEYSKIKTSFGFFSMVAQTGTSSSLTVKELVNQLPRKLKKLATNAIEETKSYRHYSLKDYDALDRFQDIVETILAGRVAESMRALTHEILTPIQGAVNDLEHITKKVTEFGVEIPEIERLTKNILTTVQISKRISLLLSSDVSYNEQSFRKVTVHKIIDAISLRYRSIAEDKKIVIKHGYNSGPKLVEAVPDQLEMVFNILIENAIKYSFYGFPDKPTVININYKSENPKFLEVTVESLGCFITYEEIKERRIFELGYRGEFSTDRRRKGTGSGLYIADKIMRAHSGRIEVSSRQLENESDPPVAVNRFTVFLPVYQDSSN